MSVIDNFSLDGQVAIVTAGAAVVVSDLKLETAEAVAEGIRQQGGRAEALRHAPGHLCSPAASWISGQVLTVSGGGVQELDG